MTTGILFAASAERWDDYEAALTRALDAAGVTDYRLAPDLPDAEVDYIVYAPVDTDTDFSRFPRLRAVLSLWAGVETIVGNPTLNVPLTRMVDRGLTEGMVEWVAGQVLRHHLDIDRVLNATTWDPFVPPLAADRPVGILGLGALGAACARALTGLGFPVAGWSRSPKRIEGVTCHHGPEGLEAVLESSRILILMMPLTPETENTLDARAIARMPQGAMVINPGRGPLIDDEALLAALDAGHLAHATLDVFREEPLPDTHPFRAHPRVTVSPHIASATRPGTASEVVAENIRRDLAGEPLLHVVDRDAGY